MQEDILVISKMSSSKAGDEYAAASSSKSEYYFDLEFEKSRKLSKNPKGKVFYKNKRELQS